MYDQVYWMLTFGEDAPRQAGRAASRRWRPYTIFVDGISKAFAATGVRVGWVVGPPDVIARMSDILGHVGAWAPRPEQVATATFLDDALAIRGVPRRAPGRRRGAARRAARRLHGAERRDGLPVDAIAPDGRDLPDRASSR